MFRTAEVQFDNLSRSALLEILGALLPLMIRNPSQRSQISRMRNQAERTEI